MRIDHFDIYRLQLPFRLSFKHSKASRKTSDSVLVKCVLKDGTEGYGESLPRPYVTGETVDSVIENLRMFTEARSSSPQHSSTGWKAMEIHEFDPDAFEQVEEFCRDLYQTMKDSFPEAGTYIGASVCALELALLDAFGRYFSKPCLMNESPKTPSIKASLVIGSGARLFAVTMALLARGAGFKAIKVKVTKNGSNLDVIRKFLPATTEIRVDANGAWDSCEALEWIEAHSGYNLAGVEQPLAPDDFDGLKCLTGRTNVGIILDESLRDLDDAEKLQKIAGNLLFNIRISKCGGLYNSLKIARFAIENGLGVQLGCQVGESSLLSAAQLRLLRNIDDVRFFEGCYGTYLLKEDIIANPLRFHRGGRLPECPKGPGLGVDIDKMKLSKYTKHAARVQL